MYVVVPGLVNLEGFSEVFRGSRTVVYRNPNVLPRAYLVGEVEVVPGREAADRLFAPDFDYRRKAVVAEPLPAGVEIEPNPQGSVQWLLREPNQQRLTVRSDKPALLMVLDNYYHAWRAQVGGHDVPIIRANHTFRAIPVPAGTHEVTLRYDTGYLKGPAIISALLLIGLMLVAFGGVFIERFRSKAA
jgi:hypothetical protein